MEVIYLLHVDAVACAAEYQACSHCLCEASSLRKPAISRRQGCRSDVAHLRRYFFLLLSGEVDEVVIFCTDQQWNGCLVEPSTLAVPFFDGIEGALSGQIKHEEYGDCVVANQGEHVDEFTLASKIPD